MTVRRIDFERDRVITNTLQLARAIEAVQDMLNNYGSSRHSK
jgi:hypothetical protein